MKRLIILLLLICFSCEASAQNAAYPKPLKTFVKDGISIPVYDFKTFEPFLKISNDTTYVVNFWATWCMPCVAELPHFEKANKVYKHKKVKVILVSLDMKKDVETKLPAFIKKKKLQSKIVYMNDPDANSWIMAVDKSWSGAIPATVIYNAYKRKFYEQSFTFEELDSEIKQFNN